MITTDMLKGIIEEELDKIVRFDDSMEPCAHQKLDGYKRIYVFTSLIYETIDTSTRRKDKVRTSYKVVCSEIKAKNGTCLNFEIVKRMTYNDMPPIMLKVGKFTRFIAKEEEHE